MGIRIKEAPSGKPIEGSADGQVLVWNNTTKRWDVGTASGGGGLSSLGATLTLSGFNEYTILEADADSAGMYSVTYTIYCGFTGNGQQVLSVRKNGVEVFGGSVYPASESGPSPHALDTFPVPLAEGDILSVQITGDTLSGGFSSDWGVTAQKLSPLP